MFNTSNWTNIKASFRILDNTEIDVINISLKISPSRIFFFSSKSIKRFIHCNHLMVWLISEEIL